MITLHIHLDIDVLLVYNVGKMCNIQKNQNDVQNNVQCLAMFQLSASHTNNFLHLKTTVLITECIRFYEWLSQNPSFGPQKRWQ